MGRKAARGQPRLPPSPAEFKKCNPPLAHYGQHWVRLAAIARKTLTDWDDRAVSRFSHPTHPFKVLYLADTKETAFWEVFGAQIEDMPVDNRALYQHTQVDTRHWVNFEIPRSPHSLRIIDTTNDKTLHDLRCNASTWLAPYKHCQAWARALMDHPSKFDGFIYRW